MDAKGNSSDKLSRNRDIDGEFGRLHCDGRTPARGASRSTFNSKAQEDKQQSRRARAHFIGPTTRIDAGYADVHDVTPDPGISVAMHFQVPSKLTVASCHWTRSLLFAVAFN
jgi:hypothetical protein